MDLPSASLPAGLALTHTRLNSELNRIIAHAITRADFSGSFAWGADVDLLGFGLSSARHINGTVVDARFFLNGNDSAAIQAAVDYVAASSEGRGVVLIPSLGTTGGAGGWVIDSTISMASGVSVIGVGMPQLRKAFSGGGGAIFSYPASARDFVVRDMLVWGASKSGSVVALDSVSNAEVSGIIVGVPDDSGSRNAGPIVSIGGTSVFDVAIRNNYGMWCDGIVDCSASTGTSGIRVTGNMMGAPTGAAGNYGTNPAIYFQAPTAGHVDLEISGNYLNLLRYSGAGGVSISGGTASANINIMGNYILGGGGHGYYIENVVGGVNIMNNASLNAGEYGVSASTTSDGCQLNLVVEGAMVRNNVFSCLPQAARGAIALGCRYGININNANVQGAIVEHNFLEDIGAAYTTRKWLCNTAGIRDAGTSTRRRGNHIVEGQGTVSTISGISTAYCTATMNGVRTLATDAPRHNQVIAVIATGAFYEPSPPGSSGQPVPNWQNDVAGAGSFFPGNNTVAIRYSAAPSANHRVVLDLIA